MGGSVRYKITNNAKINILINRLMSERLKFMEFLSTLKHL